MHARITKVDIQPGKINDVIKAYKENVLPATKEQEGFKHAILLVDRDASIGFSITIWEDEEKLALSEVSTYYVEQLRKLAQYFAGLPTRDSYEVVVFDTN
jgi:heme-degrading monooxygenase HmoA